MWMVCHFAMLRVSDCESLASLCTSDNMLPRIPPLLKTEHILDVNCALCNAQLEGHHVEPVSSYVKGQVGWPSMLDTLELFPTPLRLYV